MHQQPEFIDKERPTLSRRRRERVPLMLAWLGDLGARSVLGLDPRGKAVRRSKRAIFIAQPHNFQLASRQLHVAKDSNHADSQQLTAPPQGSIPADRHDATNDAAIALRYSRLRDRLTDRG